MNEIKEILYGIIDVLDRIDDELKDIASGVEGYYASRNMFKEIATIRRHIDSLKLDQSGE